MALDSREILRQVQNDEVPSLDSKFGVSDVTAFHRVHSRLVELLRPTLQAYLHGLEGVEFKSEREMIEFVANVQTILDRLDLAVKVPNGKYRGTPARLIARTYGPNREPRITFRWANSSATDYRIGPACPRLDLCPAPPRRSTRQSSA